jgi:type IV secretion system protein VirB4
MNPSVGQFSTQLPWNYITKYHEGVVIQKDGVMQRTFAFRAPDTDSSSAFEVNGVCVRVNDFAKRLGSGWAFQVEAQRFYTREYPAAKFEYGAGSFDTLAAYLVDREREESFKAYGAHYESSYYITFIYKPFSENVKKLTKLFIRSGADNDESGKNIRENVETFVTETNNVVAVLANDILIEPLNNVETVTYLHSSVSLKRFELDFPRTSIFLDRILPDSDLITSLTMKLDEYYIPIVGVYDFPDATYPAILDALNRARLEYRWVSRYISTDKAEGKAEATKKEKAHRGSRKSFLQTFVETTSGETCAGAESRRGREGSRQHRGGYRDRNRRGGAGVLYELRDGVG